MKVLRILRTMIEGVRMARKPPTAAMVELQAAMTGKGPRALAAANRRALEETQGGTVEDYEMALARILREM